jgi:hypothetical protein
MNLIFISLNIISVKFKNNNGKGIPGSRREIDLGQSKKKIQVLKKNIKINELKFEYFKKKIRYINLK